MEKTTYRRFIKSTIFISTVLITLISILCTREVQKETGGNNIKEKDKIVKEYLEEGFISKDIFRIVVVTPKDSDDKIEIIKETARHRAFISLLKYLSSQNRVINQNTRARLLNLTNKNGSLMRLKDKGKTRRVYLFEIKKANIKNYIDNITLRK